MYAIRVLALVFVVAAFSNSSAIAVVCRSFNFAGFEEQSERAISVIGAATTTDRTKMKVYVSVVKGQLFVQTNYVLPGRMYPTKLALDEKVSLEMIVWNLLTDDPAKVTLDEVDKAICNDIEFFVDRFHLNQSSFADLDFTQAKKVFWDPTPSAPQGVPRTSATQLQFQAKQSQPPPKPATSDQLPKNLHENALVLCCGKVSASHLRGLRGPAGGVCRFARHYKAGNAQETETAGWWQARSTANE